MGLEIMRLDHSMTGKSIWSRRGTLLDLDMRVQVHSLRFTTFRGPRHKLYPVVYGNLGFFAGVAVGDLRQTIAAGIRVCR